jgi:lipoprotein-releasing system permease protein
MKVFPIFALKLPNYSVNFPWFIASRISIRSGRAVSRLVVILAILSVTLGVAVMEISLGVVNGFEREIRDKLIGFGSHIRIVPYGDDESGSGLIQVNPEQINVLESIQGVASVAPVIQGYALLQSDETLEGISLKGVEKNYDLRFFKNALRMGEIPPRDYESGPVGILISHKQAQKLKLKPGDKARLYFLLDPPKIRPVVISGIYETGLAEFDALTVVCPASFLRKIYNIPSDKALHYELKVKDFEELEKITQETRSLTPYNQMAYSIRELYPEMFAWLGLQHQNVNFILGLMILIALINMSSVLLILILERTRMIGLLKALGARQSQLRNIFLWNGALLISIGLVLGNLLGIGILALQSATGWMKLDQESYFLSEVPVEFVWGDFLITNLGLIGICLIFLILPARLIASIRISEALRFD